MDEIAASIRKPVNAVAQLLETMLAHGFVVRDGTESSARYRMNRAQPTVAKVYKTLDPGHMPLRTCWATR